MTVDPFDYATEPVPEPRGLTSWDLGHPDPSDPGYQARRAVTMSENGRLLATIEPPELSTPKGRRAPAEEEAWLAGYIAEQLEAQQAERVVARNAIDAADLLELDLPPLRWIVPDLLPEGTTILAAPPKVGKSCLVYQVAVECAIGGELLGRRVEPGSVLYLALEDGRRRGQERLRAALDGRTMPRGRLEVRWSAPRIGAGLEDAVSEWLDAHGDAVMVAVDTLGKVRPRGDGRRNAYDVDVEDLARLQDLFRDRRVALVIVHHARKETGGDDFLASVSGTYGITGSADTIVVVRRKRLEAFGTLLVTGRDVPDAELPARFDGLTWQAAPTALAESSFERAEVYEAVRELGPIFPAAIGERLGKSRQSVQNIVGRLVEQGAIVRTGKGYEAIDASRARAGVLSPVSLVSPRETGDMGGRIARAREAEEASCAICGEELVEDRVAGPVCPRARAGEHGWRRSPEAVE